MAAVDVESWRAAYGGLLPPEYLESLDGTVRAEEWRRAIPNDTAEGRKRWFVTEGERVIGYALAGRPRGSTEGMLYLLYTAPSAWGSGAGSALLESCAEFMRSLGLPRAVLWVVEENSHARRFYEREGWRPTGSRRTDDYGGLPVAALEYARDVLGG